jgi:hypothetical protein
VLLAAAMVVLAQAPIVGVAQVVTAAVATFLAWRAVNAETARLMVVGVDVRTLSRGTGGDLVILRVAIFNPASRGNVVRSAEVHRRDRGWSLAVLPVEVEQRLVPFANSSQPQTIVYLGVEKIDVDVGIEASFPLGLAPYETKVIDFVCFGGREDDEVRKERIEIPRRERFIVDLYDGGGRRFSGHNALFDDARHWWAKLRPRGR